MAIVKRNWRMANCTGFQRSFMYSVRKVLAVKCSLWPGFIPLILSQSHNSILVHEIKVSIFLGIQSLQKSERSKSLSIYTHFIFNTKEIVAFTPLHIPLISCLDMPTPYTFNSKKIHPRLQFHNWKYPNTSNSSLS